MGHLLGNRIHKLIIDHRNRIKAAFFKTGNDLGRNICGTCILDDPALYPFDTGKGLVCNFRAQIIGCLAANHINLHLFAFALQAGHLLACQSGNRAVKAAAQALIGRNNDQKMCFYIFPANQQRRGRGFICLGSKRGDNRAHTRSIRTPAFGCFLSPAQFCCSDHLHSRSNLLRGRHTVNSGFQILQIWHLRGSSLTGDGRISSAHPLPVHPMQSSWHMRQSPRAAFLQFYLK